MAYSNNSPKEESRRYEQEKVEKTIAKINAGVVSIFDKDALPAFLAFSAKLHNFDIYNLILIYQQRPTSTFVAPYRTWQRISVNHWHDPSRPVFLSAEDRRGIGIFVPLILKKKKNDVPDLRTASVATRIISYFDYKVVYIFDKEQMNGIPTPAMDWDLAKSKIDAEAAFHAFRVAAPFDVAFSVDETFNGNFIFNEGNQNANRTPTLVLNAKHRFNYFELCNFIVRIFVARSMEEILETKYSPDEFEKMAECVSYVLASYFGLPVNAYTFFFARTWASEPKRMLEILNVIRQVSHQLIENIETEMVDYKEQFGPQEDVYAYDDDVFEFENLSMFDV